MLVFYGEVRYRVKVLGKIDLLDGQPVEGLEEVRKVCLKFLPENIQINVVPAPARARYTGRQDRQNPSG